MIKKSQVKKNNCFIHTISFVIRCLLSLVVISVNCYYCYTKHRSKQKHLLPYHDSSNELKGIDSNNIT